MLHIGRAVREIRKMRNLSRREVAHRLSISVQAVHQAEKRQSWQTDHLVSYTRVLGCSVFEIVKLADPKGAIWREESQQAKEYTN